MKETLIYDIDKLTNIKIKLLNVQCPTQAKIIEIEDNPATAAADAAHYSN